MKGKLTSEQQRALKILEDMLENWTSLLNQSLNNCTHTNFFSFSVSPIKRENLPHEEHWVWNQSNAKLCTTILNDQVTVTIQKFNARKKPKYDQRQPSYKVWIFTLENYTSEPLYAIWCEKGKQVGEEPPLVARTNHNQHHTNTASTPIQPEELRLESFDFLRDFVSEENAIEFGWIQPPQQTQQPFQPFQPNTSKFQAPQQAQQPQPSQVQNHPMQLPLQNVIPPPNITSFTDDSFTNYSQEYYRTLGQ